MRAAWRAWLICISILGWAWLFTAQSNAQVLIPVGGTGPAPGRTSTAEAVEPAPPLALTVRDKPNDDATALCLSWELSEDDGPAGRVTGYVVERSAGADGPFDEVGRVGRGTATFTDSAYSWKPSERAKERGEGPRLADPAQPHWYRVRALSERSQSAPVTAGPVRPVETGFDTTRGSVLLVLTLCAGMVLFLIRHAGTRDLYIRPIPGLEALHDAVGRATEMGKPILYSTGMGSSTLIDSIAPTMAATVLLGQIARLAAEQGTRILVPNIDPRIMSAQREVVRDAYAQAGRPEAYREEDLFFQSNAQFAYAAMVTGIMLRDRPAACFYLGYFEAESLILAETGALTGAIQIAGTDQVFQLPFFVTACDYTLMGEELYAATAYVSRAPRLLGSLKAQDWLKFAVGAVILLGVAGALLTHVFHLPPDSWFPRFSQWMGGA